MPEKHRKKKRNDMLGSDNIRKVVVAFKRMCNDITVPDKLLLLTLKRKQ